MSITNRLHAMAVVARASTTFERPDRLPRALLAMRPWGPTAAGGAAASAARYPDATAIVDGKGSITFAALWARTDSLARGLQAAGAGPGVGVGILARDHRGFVESLIAAVKTGADVVLLNTGFAGPQLADVVSGEGVALVLHDDEFAPIVQTSGARGLGEHDLAALAATGQPMTPPGHQGRMVILTSGTTGRPKGAARRADAAAIEGLAGILQRIPLRVRDTQVVAAPLFHAWGLANLLFGLGRSATTILPGRRFDPGATLDAVGRHRAGVLVVVPVMLQRLLALGSEALAAADTSALRVIASSGSAIGPTVVREVTDAFGPVLYNIYGSTEVAVATIATPDDLRASPGTAGRPALGVRVEILDETGQPVPQGERGRIFVGGAARFEGYTTGGSKEQQRGLLASGDGGFIDGDGRLQVEGREDDMIVSGGENVFPSEVEDLLGQHPAVREVAVVGVPDERFGQALAAFVVVRPGAELNADDVRDHVRAHLARYKVPRRVEFVAALPRTTTGKVLRRALLEP